MSAVRASGRARGGALGAGLGPAAAAGARARRVACGAQKGIHPEWHDEAKVICNGEEVMTVSGTRAEYNVDVWSGNHPFYTGDGSNIIQDEGRLNKFKNKYEGLDWMLGGDAAAAPADDQKGE